MPKTKSAKRALRKNIRRNARNTARKIKLKTAVKGFSKLIKEKKIEEAKQALSNVYKTVDKTAKTKFIKKGTANRIKSRLAKKLKAIEKTE